MKSFKTRFTAICGLLVLGFNAALAQTYFDGGTGVWDNTTLNWNGGVNAWTPNGSATFGGAGSTVTIGDNLQIGSITFTAPAGAYTFDNTGGYQMDFNGSGISTATAAVQLFSNTGNINFNAGASAGASTIHIDSFGNVNFTGAGATAGSSTLYNAGNLTFDSGATAGSASIDNQGNLFFNGTSTGGTATVTNGGVLDISAHTPGNSTVTLDSLVNSSIYAGPQQINGSVIVGLNKLNLNNGLSLATVPLSGNNALGFQLATTSTSGSISVLGGTFTGSDTGRTDITLTGPATPGAPGVPFVLIDWTAATASGVDLADFNLLTAPSSIGLAGYHMEIQGKQLVLVPEPATLAMPLIAIFGMVLLRRKAARVAA